MHRDYKPLGTPKPEPRWECDGCGWRGEWALVVIDPKGMRCCPECGSRAAWR